MIDVLPATLPSRTNSKMDEVYVQGYWHDQLPQVQTLDHIRQPTPSYLMLSRTNNQAQEHPKRLKIRIIIYKE